MIAVTATDVDDKLFTGANRANTSRSPRPASTSWCRRRKTPTRLRPAPRGGRRGQRHRGAAARAQSEAHARGRAPRRRAPSGSRRATATTVSAPASSTRSRRCSSPIRAPRPPRRHRPRPRRCGSARGEAARRELRFRFDAGIILLSVGCVIGRTAHILGERVAKSSRHRAALDAFCPIEWQRAPESACAGV